MKLHHRSYALATALAILLSPAAAQPFPLLHDPIGDYNLEAGPVQQQAPMSGDHVDLASLAVVEEPDSFRFDVAFHDSPWAVGYNQLDVHMSHGGQAYRIDLAADTPTGAELHRIDVLTGQSSLVGPVEADLSAAHLKLVTVPRGMLLDAEGAPPFPGRVLEDFWVVAGSWRFDLHVPEENSFGTWDRMPDEGAQAAYEVQQGDQHVGGARLWSPSPARASNGAANTFIFPVVAANEGDEDATYELRVVGQPDGWDIRVPGETFQLQAGGQYRFPVMATLPSAHLHDSTETIGVVLEEIGGSSEALLELTVVFHAIPQPAGHHPELYFHSRAGTSATGAVLPDPGVFLYMNALVDDPDDEEVAVHGTAGPVGDNAFSWSIPLHPSLQMGLDFDLDRGGTLRLPLAADAPITGARLSAELVWRQGSDEQVLGSMGPSDPFDLGPAGGEHTVVLDWVPEADLVPYQGLASLALLIHLEGSRPATFTAPEAPKILPGGSLTLPLSEYEDPIDPAFLENPDSRLVVTSAASKEVNPGRTTTFDLELQTGPGASTAYRIDVSGINSAWAAWPADIEITPGKIQAFKVSVEAPAGAHPGEVADLVVAAHPEGTGEAALARLQATVAAGSEEGGKDIPDEAGTAEPGATRNAGAAAPTVVLVALGVGMATRRRA